MTDLPPHGLPTESRHDGVHCTLGPDPRNALLVHATFYLGAAAVLVGAVAPALTGASWLLAAAPPGLGLLGLWALLVSQYARRTEVEVTDRAVTIVRHRLFRAPERIRLPLDELEVRRGMPRYEGDSGMILISHGEEVHAVGHGRPDPHLAWVVAAIVQARQHLVEREQREGREWGFMKKAPDAVEALRGGREPEAKG